MKAEARTVTRRQVADAIDELDDQLADLQELKKAVYQNYRAALAARGFGKEAIKAEAATLKLAIRQRRNIEKDPEAARARRGLFDEILTEITLEPSRGARARSKEDASSEKPLHSVIAEEAAAEVARAEAEAAKAEREDGDGEGLSAEERRKRHIKAVADRAEERSRRTAPTSH